MSTLSLSRPSVAELATYSLATYLPGVLILVSTYIFTRMLAPDEYGVFALWSATVLMIGSITIQWLRQSILRYWKEYVHTEEAAQFRHTVTDMAWLVCALLLGLGTLGSIGFFVLSAKYLLNFSIIGILAAIFFCWTTVQLSIWQADRKSSPYAISRIITAVITVLVSFTLLIYMRNALALGIGSIVGSGAAACYGYVKLSRLPSTRVALSAIISPRIANRMLMYGLPFGGWFIGTQIMSYADRFILGFVGTAAAVGAYSAIYTLMNGLISFLTTPLLTAAHPAIVAAWSASEEKDLAAHALWQYVRLFTLIALPVSAGAVATSQSIARLLVPEGYYPDGWLVSLLVVGLFLNMFGLFAHKGLEMAEKTRQMLGLAALCALVNVVFCVLLIPWMGARGGALATLIAYLLYVVLGLWISRPYLHLQMDWRSLQRTSFASLGVFGVAWLLGNLAPPWPPAIRLIAIVCASALVYLALLLILKEFSPCEVWGYFLSGYSRLRGRGRADLQPQ